MDHIRAPESAIYGTRFICILGDLLRLRHRILLSGRAALNAFWMTSRKTGQACSALCFSGGFYLLPHVPQSVNLFQAMGASSPLFTHTFPWTSMGVSVAASVIFFLVALKIAESREY